MAATKRNAGLTSAVPRATLNDEELVGICNNFYCLIIYIKKNTLDHISLRQNVLLIRLQTSATL